jgi:Metallo-peptidase family M12
MKIFGRTAVRIVFLAAALGASGRAAAQTGVLRAGDPGQVVDLPGGRGLGEFVSFDVAFAPRLLAMKPEEGQEVTDFPTTPGVRRRVYLVRHEIYAEGARIFRVDGRFYTEIPRSRFLFFWGSDLEGAGNRLFISLDPDTGSFTGLVHGPEGMHEIARDPSDRRGRHLLAEPQAPQGATWTCGQEDSVETAVSWAPPEAERLAAVSIHPNVLTSLHSAVVAIDTDNEYLAYWGNNTTNVTNYIAALLASINVMYERDLNLRLLQGTTFLRVSTTPDPYVQSSGSGASSAELTEFTNYWNATYPKASYPRSVATMLSGKQSLNNSASGIAWVASSVCGSSYDYSFCQVFKINYLVGDTLVVGHEIGHNLGSPHTHCYADPKPDTCYAQETGTNCFSGTPSCPASLMINGYNATGTIMSYCHLSPCSSSSTLAFHPLTISRYVGTTLDAGASSGCLAVVGGGTPPVSAATMFNVIPPCRVLDTRNATGPLGGPSMAAGGLRSFVAAGVCNVPAGAVAISANVAVVNPAAAGNLAVYPNGLSSPPTASTLTFRAGQTRANNTIVYLAPDGSFLVKNNAGGALDVVLDVNGYFK